MKDQDGEERRRKPPQGASPHEIKVWKRIVNKAWVHDRNFLGACYWMDLGLGLAPLVDLIPIIGPMTMYALHGRILTLSEELRVPASLHAKMSSNILFDFLMALIPVVGAIFGWMNACSTRNAALLDTWLRFKIEHRQNQLGPFQELHTAPQRPTTVQSNGYGTGRVTASPQRPPQNGYNRSGFTATQGPQFTPAAAPPKQSKKPKRGQAAAQEVGVL